MTSQVVLLMVAGHSSSERTRELLSWQPRQPALLADLESGGYFES